MNIIIKDADFSAVSIGTAGTMEKESTLTNVFFATITSGSPAGINCIINNKILCYDVSGMDGKIVKIVGYRSNYYSHVARFYSAQAPSDTTYSSEDMSTLNSYLGTPLSTLDGAAGGMYTDTVEVPTGAKTLCIFAGAKYEDECSCVELL